MADLYFSSGGPGGKALEYKSLYINENPSERADFYILLDPWPSIQATRSKTIFVDVRIS